MIGPRLDYEGILAIAVVSSATVSSPLEHGWPEYAWVLSISILAGFVSIRSRLSLRGSLNASLDAIMVGILVFWTGKWFEVNANFLGLLVGLGAYIAPDILSLIRELSKSSRTWVSQWWHKQAVRFGIAEPETLKDEKKDEDKDKKDPYER